MSTRTKPVHLHSIARELGVRRVSLREMDMAGRVLWDGCSPSITLRADLPAPRRRFTLAHELAHVLLQHGAPSQDSAPTDAQLRAEERLCDAIASATLLSADDLAPLLDAQALTLAAVRQVAEQTQVSMSAVVSRLTDLDPRTHLLLRLQSIDDEWVALRMIGRNRGLAPVLNVPPEHASDVAGLPTGDADVRLSARIGRHGFVLTGTGNRRGTRALMLITGIRREPALDQPG